MIDKVLDMLQNADPTGETNPDPPDMCSLEGNSTYRKLCYRLVIIHLDPLLFLGIPTGFKVPTEIFTTFFKLDIFPCVL